MMAVQGLDVLWNRASFSVIFLVITAAGANKGTSVYSVDIRLRSVTFRQHSAELSQGK